MDLQTIKDMISGTVSQMVSKPYNSPPYDAIRQVGNELPFEERIYEGGRKWACTKMVVDPLTEHTEMFWKLYKYISGENEGGVSIAMTAPVKTEHRPLNDGRMEKKMCFYLHDQHQENPPAPNNPDVFIETHDQMNVYTRIKGGWMTPATWLQERQDLEALLKQHGCHIETDRYFTCGYNSPHAVLNRRNELWMIKKEN